MRPAPEIIMFPLTPGPLHTLCPLPRILCFLFVPANLLLQVLVKCYLLQKALPDPTQGGPSPEYLPLAGLVQVMILHLW